MNHKSTLKSKAVVALRYFLFAIFLLALAFTSSLRDNGNNTDNEETTTQSTSVTTVTEGTTEFIPDEITRDQDHTEEPEPPPIQMYYWVWYSGSGPVPRCAIKGGDNGYPTYIGKTYYKHSMTHIVEVYLTTTLKGFFLGHRRCSDYWSWQDKGLLVAWRGGCHLLCTDYPQQFEWIYTKYIWEWFWLPQKMNLVIGGDVDGWPTVVGKSAWESYESVAAVYINPYDIKFTYTYFHTLFGFMGHCYSHQELEGETFYLLAYTDICPTTDIARAPNTTTHKKTNTGAFKNPLFFVSMFNLVVALFF